MEIKIYQQPADLSTMSKRDIEIYQALQTRYLKDIEDSELYEIFKSNISKSYLMSNYTSPDPPQFVVIIDETMKVFKNRFGFIREAEINLIFVRGLSKEFGDFMGLGFITFVDWASSYIKDLTRIKLTKPVETKINPSDEEIYHISKTNALTAFNDVKLKGTVGRFGVVVYDFLEKIGLLALSQEEKNAFWKKAKQEYAGYLTMAIGNPVDMTEKRKLEADYQSFMEGGKQDKLIVISKRLIVDDKFAKMIFNDEELKDLI